MDFKAGDKVKLVRTDGEEWEWYKNHLGKTFTIKEIGKDWSNEEFAELEENDELMPFVKNLELVKPEYTYEDFKKSPIGTKVTFESGIILIKVDEDYYRETKSSGIYRNLIDLNGLKDKYYCSPNQGKIIKIEEPEYTTVYECKPEILDEAEKRYLSNVIRPFRDKVKNIIKTKSNALKDKEYIIIRIINGNNIPLPYFDKNTMYKGMRLNKEYTLEELGI